MKKIAKYILVLFLPLALLAGETKHALVIGLDGVLPAALKVAKTPSMDSLIQNGAISYNVFAGGEKDTETQQATSSGPGWSSILTGVWINKHRVPDNDFKNPDYENYPHFFTRIKQVKPNAYLSSIVNWKPIHKHILSDADFADTGNDEQVASKAAKHLLEKDPLVMFLHFDEVDGAGHSNGYNTKEKKYLDAISTVDNHVGTVVRAIAKRAKYENEDWLIVIVTDHGGKGKGHGGQSDFERNIFMIVSGKNSQRGELLDRVGMVAVPPIVFTHLGLPIKTEWGWDGKPFGLNK